MAKKGKNLTEEQKSEIVDMHLMGEYTYKEIAKKMKIWHTTVKYILTVCLDRKFDKFKIK